MRGIPLGLYSTVLQSLLSNKVGLFNKFSFKVGQGFYFCARAISILKWEHIFLTEKISAVSMRRPVSACCLSCVRSFYTTKPLPGGFSVGDAESGWEGQGGGRMLWRDPRSWACGAGAWRARWLPRASQAGGPIDRRFVFCFVRPHTLRNPKQEFREGGTPCQEISQISCDLSVFPDPVSRWPGSWSRVCNAGPAVVCLGEGLGCAWLRSGDWEEGDLTPHLFGAVPEDHINFIFLAMTWIVSRARSFVSCL